MNLYYNDVPKGTRLNQKSTDRPNQYLSSLSDEGGKLLGQKSFTMVSPLEIFGAFSATCILASIVTQLFDNLKYKKKLKEMKKIWILKNKP